MKTISSSFTVVGREPGYLEISRRFEDIINDFFDLEINDVGDGKGEAWVITVTYPTVQAKEYAEIIMKVMNVETQIQI